MTDPRTTTDRKAEHLRIVLDQDVQGQASAGFERIRLAHRALPECDLLDVDLSVEVFGRRLRVPLLISSMTGGTPSALAINRDLATVAEEAGIGMGLGSLRAALEDSNSIVSWDVRQYAPNILLLANIGAVQLNYGLTVDDARRIVDLVRADGLILHLNALQEALQPEGQTNFSGLLRKIEQLCGQLAVPVVVKEVGWGISARVARQLEAVGVAAIDVAGGGGTSWSQVEMYRIHDPVDAEVARSFRDWGIPTTEAIRQVRGAVHSALVFASGGVRNGIDVAKCIALGAAVVGMARPLLEAAAVSADQLRQKIDIVQRQLRLCMFATGSANLRALQSVELLED